MVRTIFIKEWIKLRWYMLVLILLGCVSVGYFWMELHFEFSNSEPESILWYRFAHLGDKPYLFFSPLFMGMGAVIALVQFVWERFRNRLRIIAHLPLSMPRILIGHLGVGIGLLSLVCFSVGGVVLTLMCAYYPYEIAMVALKDMTFYFLGALLSYLLGASVVLERHAKIALLKLSFGVLVLFLFQKERYVLMDTLWLGFIFSFFLLCLDSFYSVKWQRVRAFFLAMVVFVCMVWIGFEAYGTYTKRYARSFTHYYLFYSPIKEDFVYQKNFGHHRFEYGIKEKETFNQKEYEALLPFVYWRDLDIQGRLPLDINGEIFSKERIQDSRLSMTYEPQDRGAKEVALYPLLNPKTMQGLIAFPENAIAITQEKIVAYNFDEGFNATLSDEIASALSALHVSFPLQGFWGKVSNLKPYDLGYLFVDAQGKLFNLKRENNRIELKEIAYPKDIRIEHLFISENSEKKVVGYAIDSHNKIYILDTTFHFTPLDVEGFDAKTMKFQLISDPLHYLLRLDDGKTYRVILFSKHFEKEKEEIFTN
ncbi:DUF4857 domain-containing protein [Sulfurospirillum barnesii]|uniref:DUF4857 domain-containing protein n=1 Tax=Sulfurospirillum barnesii (strain ATCC 700032 / DSM 10660 / SES-3) TaxID=760154 RepID=I3XY78_SULBS|nr:DUF4857 domain-containing protein [Sulfurospirillum barnesii]AFL68902.1 hypothetical protein Sulba_1614 [Sulfurospirillum barnesii SES-3]